MKLYRQDSEFAKRPILTTFESIIIFILYALILSMSMPNFRNSHHNSRDHQYKTCSDNIRVLSTSIEMYNFDSKTSMKNLDQEILFKEKYIKRIIENELDKECIYKSLGDLSGAGFIYCEKHGNLQGMKIKPDMSFQDYLNEQDKIELEQKERANRQKLLFTFNMVLLFAFPLLHLILHMIMKKDSILTGIIEFPIMILFLITIIAYSNCLN